MFNWVRRIFRARRPNKKQDFNEFLHIVGQIQREHIERKGVSPDYHPEFVRLCRERNFETMPADGDHPEAILRKEFHKYFGTRVFGGKKAGRAMEFEIGFIRDPTFNAWAASGGVADLIGVNSGLPIVLDAAIRALLSHPHLFPDVGDPAICTRHVFSREITSLPLDSRSWRTAPLECPVREALAMRIWSVALCFMIEHEFAHVWRGHTDYAAESLGLTRLDEVSDIPGDLTMHAMEIDADRAAATQTLRFALSPPIEPVAEKIKWHVPSIVQSTSTREIVERCTIAACLYGLLASSPRASDNTDYMQSTHPPAIVRTIANLNRIVLTLNAFAGHDFRTTLHALNPVTEAMIESIKALLPGGCMDFSGDRLVGEAPQLIDTYNHQLLALRPKLNRFRRGRMLETENPFYW